MSDIIKSSVATCSNKEVINSLRNALLGNDITHDSHFNNKKVLYFTFDSYLMSRHCTWGNMLIYASFLIINI